MDKEEDKKKLNDDLVVFMRKRSEIAVPRYTARLKTYVDFHQKRRRAAAAHRNSELNHSKRKLDNELKDKNEIRDPQAEDERGMRRRAVEKSGMFKKLRSPSSRSGSVEPSDRCGRKRRRKSCGRRRRRRRSCRRKRRRRSCRRRRRRSCRRRRSRRRRRRSCRRRRRRSRRRRRKC